MDASAHRARRAPWLTALLAIPLAWLAPPSSAVAASTDDGSIEITAQLDRDVYKAGETQRAHLRIAIGAKQLGAKRRDAKFRAPMNIALVIDRSGSMAGQGRIDNARRAAMMAVDRLGRDDILSVVSYDDRVEVDVPATKVTSPDRIKDRIQRLTPRGSTAIHAGLLAGAEEIRKFKSRDRVNRIILLSDGLANVGPSRPSDFVSLGRELAGEGITVSSIGLGSEYNEDLMAGLARAADGGHVFVRESADLAGFLAREFDDALGIVAQDVEIIITLDNGVKPIRSLGREAVIDGRRFTFKVGSLFGSASQIIVAEIEIDAATTADRANVAEIEVRYSDALTGARGVARATTTVRFDPDQAVADRSINAEVTRDVSTLVSREARQEAIRLRDAGRVDDAERKFKENAATIRQLQAKVPGASSYAPLQDELAASEAAAAPAAKSADGWDKARKQQRATDGNQSGSRFRY